MKREEIEKLLNNIVRGFLRELEIIEEKSRIALKDAEETGQRAQAIITQEMEKARVRENEYNKREKEYLSTLEDELNKCSVLQKALDAQIEKNKKLNDEVTKALGNARNNEIETESLKKQIFSELEKQKSVTRSIEMEKESLKSDSKAIIDKNKDLDKRMNNLEIKTATLLNWEKTLGDKASALEEKEADLRIRAATIEKMEKLQKARNG